MFKRLRRSAEKTSQTFRSRLLGKDRAAIGIDGLVALDPHPREQLPANLHRPFADVVVEEVVHPIPIEQFADRVVVTAVREVVAVRANHRSIGTGGIGAKSLVEPGEALKSCDPSPPIRGVRAANWVSQERSDLYLGLMLVQALRRERDVKDHRVLRHNGGRPGFARGNSVAKAAS